MSPGADPLTMDIEKLRRVLDALLDHVETTMGRFVDVGRDHYWLLELGGAFSEDLHQPESADLGVGRIADDVETVHELASELERGDASLIPWHDLEHAVGLLRALAFRDLPSS